MNYEKQRIEELLNRPKEGYCRICKKLGSLSADHVPPKCVGNKDSVVIKYGDGQRSMQAGAKFSTICKECNSLLGRKYDIEFKKLYDEMRFYEKYKRFYSRYVGITLNKINFLRSICGHLLAVYFGDNIEEQIQAQPYELEFLEKQRKFVLGETDDINKIRFFYWYYPFDEIEINQYWAMMPNIINNTNQKIFGATFKSYPIGIWIIDMDNSTVVPKLQEILINNDEEVLKIDVKRILQKEHPIIPPDSGASLMSLNSILKINKKGE